MSLATPIIKVKKQKNVHEFYTLTEFDKWKETIDNLKQWTIKYYKGLGTSTSEEAKGYFTNIEKKNIKYLIGNEMIEDTDISKSKQKIELAFDKKKAEDKIELLSPASLLTIFKILTFRTTETSSHI